MISTTSDHCFSRRQFLVKGVVGGTSLCLGCSVLASLALAQDKQNNKTFQENVTENSNMSFEQVFNFAFRDTLIPELIMLSRQIGREKLVDMLKETTDEIWFSTELQKRFEENLPKGFWDHVIDVKVLLDTPELKTYKVTKCLWAKTFREADAADIGYALWCYGDYAIARSQKGNLERNTTLMQGDDCCVLKYTNET